MVLIGCFIDLMETFIGEAVTVWLLNDIWQDLPGSRIKLREKIRRNQHDQAAIRKLVSKVIGITESPVRSRRYALRI